MKARLPSLALFFAFAIFLASLPANAQTAFEKKKIICDHAAPPRGMHYVCKSQCDCHLEGKLKNDEDGIVPPRLATQDLKITTHTTTDMNGHIFNSEDTLYMRAEKIRREFHAQLPDGSVREQGFIDLCDAHQAIELDPQRHEYRVVDLGDDGLAKGWQETMSSSQKEKPSRGGTVEIVTENIDTRETKTVLGHSAHHWITKVKTIPGPGACASADESEIDGWYIDNSVPAGTCSARFLQKKYPRKANSHAVLTAVHNGCADRFKFTGDQLNHGMPVLLKHVAHLQSRLPSGNPREFTSRSEMEVTELSTAPGDAKIFEIPEGYSRVPRLRTDGPPRTINERLQVMWEQIKVALGR